MNTNFSIQAQTCTLKVNDQKNGSFLLSPKKKYVIPIYQRPYAWKQKQIEEFITDIFTAYWGYDGNGDEESPIKEPMFIGTMQLSPRTVVKGNEGTRVYDVIDGQQRLTTFLLLLKILRIKFTKSKQLETISLDWLSTIVNNGEEQADLAKALSSSLEESVPQNKYIQNARFIQQTINKFLDDEYEDSEIFIQFLLSKIYFVVIETQAGLSKTLQIFKAINTTGLDLNGGDIFKIRFYEYLRNKKGEPKEIFNEVSKIYERIKNCNKVLKPSFMNIGHILNIYQYILISKHKMPRALYYLASDTFFERLFDTIFNIKQWDGFKSHEKDIDISLEDINAIIDMRHLWEQQWKSKENMVGENIYNMNFIWLSRYSRYWILPCVFMFAYRNEENMLENMKDFTRELSKLYTAYSIRYQKLKKDIYYKFTHKILKSILDPNQSAIESIMLIKENRQKNQGLKNDITKILNGDILYNAKLKNIVCRLSAMLEEDYQSNVPTTIDKIGKNLFTSPIDIEHIQPYHDKIKENRPDIWDKWGSNINSIGNLMILERKKNKSIGNKKYKNKSIVYQKSQFAIVKKQAQVYAKWDLEDCLERKQNEIDKITGYLFS